MISLEDLYFEWLLTCIDPEGVTEGLAHLCGLLHDCEFKRRVGNDMNRAVDGINLRKEFLDEFSEADVDPHVTNDLMAQNCSWLEMLIRLSRDLDFLYDGGVDGRFFELISNLKLGHLAIYKPNRTKDEYDYDQREVDIVTSDVDRNRFDRNGRGGLFPLRHVTGHPDQREVEIWDQHAVYFREKLEGVQWTSIS